MFPKKFEKWYPKMETHIYQVNSCKLVCVIDFLAVDSQRFLGISWTGTYHKSLVGMLIPSRFNPGLMASSKSDWMSNHAQMIPTVLIRDTWFDNQCCLPVGQQFPKWWDLASTIPEKSWKSSIMVEIYLNDPSRDRLQRISKNLAMSCW